MDKRKLLTWIQTQVYEETDDGRVTKLVLKHAQASGKASSILEIKITEKSEPGDLAGAVLETAHDDAGGLGGVQRYVLQAIRTDKVSGRFSFRLQVDDDSDDVESSEPATKTGLVAQQMRHNEALMRSTVLASGETIRVLQRQNERLQEALDKSLDDRLQMIELIEKLKSRDLERQLMMQEAERKDQMQAELFTKASILLPAVVNKISGKKLLPEHTTPETELVGSLMESLSEEQMAKLTSILGPDQQLAVYNLYEQWRERAEKRKIENGKKAQP